MEIACSQPIRDETNLKLFNLESNIMDNIVMFFKRTMELWSQILFI
jgi:hypothetical protein